MSELLRGLGSDAPALGRAATVVGGGRDVLDGADLEADRTQGADRGLAAGPGALDEDVDLLHAVVHRTTPGGLGSHLGGVRRGLARALEADGAGRGPRDHRTGRVGDRDDRVVERALDVGFALGDVLLLLAAHLLGAGRGAALGRHSVLLVLEAWDRDGTEDAVRHLAFFLPATVRFGPLRVRALVLVRWPRTGRPWRWRRPW